MESDKGNIVQTGLVVGVEILAAVSLLAGGFGMLASLWFLGYSHMMDVLAGARDTTIEVSSTTYPHREGCCGASSKTSSRLLGCWNHYTRNSNKR